jgi:hypothetical protein
MAILGADLISRVTPLFTGGDDLVMPPEWQQIKAAIDSLPRHGAFVVYDPELEEGREVDGRIGGCPDFVNVLPSSEVSSWDGSEEGSWGYGDVTRVDTAAGPGLVISVSGSPMASAYSFFILPHQWPTWTKPE